ncbi:MAG TPA: potassium channel protein [Candidatus Marinimicrobia bacterium]|nr:potassium channel protein [Candidatus Neomarinimicrobiota bacterium]HIM74472.1 potassium channel protein [Candidatus Neomarinimicrobiota bacterium]
MQVKTRFRFFIYFSSVIFIGSLGFYSLGHDWSVLESVYMTIITLSPVGTGETQPLTDAGKIWAIIVILFGVTVVAYLFTEFSKELFRLDLYRRNKMLKSVKKLHNHYIICGYGRMGAVIARELHEKGRPFVIIDNNPEKIKKIDEKGYFFIEGDATIEETLHEAGVERASGIVVVLNTDQDNLFVCMSIRSMNNDAFLVSRCSVNDNLPKLRRVGVDKVVNPYVAGGHKMSELLLSPQLEDSVTIKSPQQTSIDFGIDEIQLSELDRFDGMMIKDCRLREDYELSIVGIIDTAGNVKINPGSEEVLHMDQTIMIIGKKENLERLTASI